MRNIGIIFTEHVKNQTARVSVTDSFGDPWNYVVIICSPWGWNGVYKYPAKEKSNFKVWWNKKQPCYEVPLNLLEKVMEVEDIKTPDIIKLIERMRKEYKDGGYEEKWCYV